MEDLIKGYQELTSNTSNYSFFPCSILVAEEFIDGPIFDGGFAVDAGKVISAITQERVWTIPPSGGFGAKNVTREIPEIIDYGTRIFNHIHWSGPAQLEFIYDQSACQYKLIEINPRFWGTLALAIKAGVNIAEDVILTGLGQSNNNGIKTAPDGIEFKWLLQEALTAEKMRGGSKNILIRQIYECFSNEISNFSYSISTNLLLAIPHLIYYFSKDSGKKKSNSLAKQLFE